MGYFSNGTEGMQFEEDWCSRCVHQDVDGDVCPVWDAHQLHNYRDCNDKGSILHMLIERTTAFENRCLMFYAKAADGDLLK